MIHITLLDTKGNLYPSLLTIVPLEAVFAMPQKGRLCINTPLQLVEIEVRLNRFVQDNNLMMRVTRSPTAIERYARNLDILLAQVGLRFEGDWHQVWSELRSMHIGIEGSKDD